MVRVHGVLFSSLSCSFLLWDLAAGLENESSCKTQVLESVLSLTLDGFHICQIGSALGREAGQCCVQHAWTLTRGNPGCKTWLCWWDAGQWAPVNLFLCLENVDINSTCLPPWNWGWNTRMHGKRDGHKVWAMMIMMMMMSEPATGTTGLCEPLWNT